MSPTASELRECPSSGQLMEQARLRTGLDDFGDSAHRGALDAYLASVAGEVWPGMTARAREIATEYLTHQLAVRLRLADDRKAHPEIARQKIERPLIIVGPPRSGSTLLHTLLSLDPEAMAPEHWLCREPSPPLALGAPTAERLEAAEQRTLALFELIPDIFITHPYLIEEGAGALAECGSDIMSMVSTSQQLWCLWGGDGYKDYLLEADHTAALGFHHQFLQHIQWGKAGSHWALKSSDSMLWLGELAARYPDARLVWTHRDLAQQLGSLASVQSILLGIRGHPVSEEARRAQGKIAIELQCQSFEKGIRAREAAGEGQFFDISYHDVMAAPLRAVERIYEWAGMKFSSAHAEAIRVWLANNQQTKHGVHKHSPDEFGLEKEAVNRRFGQYVERFGFGFGIRPAAAV